MHLENTRSLKFLFIKSDGFIKNNVFQSKKNVSDFQRKIGKILKSTTNTFYMIHYLF